MYLATRPTPEFIIAVRHLHTFAGIMITAVITQQLTTDIRVW